MIDPDPEARMMELEMRVDSLETAAKIALNFMIGLAEGLGADEMVKQARLALDDIGERTPE